MYALRVWVYGAKGARDARGNGYSHLVAMLGQRVRYGGLAVKLLLEVGKCVKYECQWTG